MAGVAYLAVLENVAANDLTAQHFLLATGG